MTMKTPAAALLFAATLSLAACGGKKEPAPDPSAARADAQSTAPASPAETAAAAMKAYTADVTQIADAISGVTDEASAHETAKVIARINPELDRLVKQIEGMNSEDTTAAGISNMPDLVAAQQKIAVAMSAMAMNDPASMKIISDELGKMPELRTN
ncbi:MAG: hypothetical protein GC155_01100 [Alphaproteobacteria bacterium]|nr:hypothetical protein [Alphaproteobacteria bacterium]